MGNGDGGRRRERGVCDPRKERRFIMCFRPSAMAGNEPQVQTGTCPSCGQPVAASVGITNGRCPYCDKPIPPEPGSDAGVVDPKQNARIL